MLLVEDAQTVVKVSKVDIAGGAELAGAELVITDSEGSIADKWVSAIDDEETTDVNEAIHEIIGLRTGETYTLTETVAPEGYAIATETTFTIDETGKITATGSKVKGGVILVEDAIMRFTVSKKAIAGSAELPGATLQILDANGDVATTNSGEALAWTSGEDEKVVKGLAAGDYVLRETVAPAGYTVATDIAFTLDTDGNVVVKEKKVENNELLIEDAKTSVKISKTDVASGEELAGAKIQILGEDGEVVRIGGERQEWISTTTPHEVIGLAAGVPYTLREVVAPEGYAIATDIEFQLDEHGKVTTGAKTTTDENGVNIILVEDAKFNGSAELSATKRIKSSIPGWTTDEEFAFTLAKTDDAQTGDTLPAKTTLKVKADETATFGAIQYTRPGTYYYTITEKASDSKHLSYHSEPQYAKVVVEEDGSDGALVTTVTYGESKTTCTGTVLNIVNSYAAPAIEKYINKDVHQDLPAFDTPFTYDILAFVTQDADRVTITDKLAGGAGIAFLNGTNTKITVQDIGEYNDHTAHGTVETADGIDIKDAVSVIDGKTLTVTQGE